MFNNRTEAGRLLAEKLASYKGKPHTMILALVHGGITCHAVFSEAL